MKVVPNLFVLEELAKNAAEPTISTFLKKILSKTQHHSESVYEALGVSSAIAIEFANMEGHIHKEDVLALLPEADKKLVDAIVKAI